MRPFLILQLRPETEASDGEFQAFLEKGGITAEMTHRIRLDQTPMPRDLDLDTFAGIVVGGGPGCVSDDPATKPETEARIEADVLSLMPEIISRDRPFLGCCYGISILAHHLGADVSKARWGEPVAPVMVTRTEESAGDALLEGVPQSFSALAGHKEATQGLPDGCVHLIASDTCPFQMIRHGQNVYATQFHPEADGEVFAERIRIYKDHGYFAPEEAETLTQAARAAKVTEAPKILANFFARFRDT
ncbi:MAG: glutamine amidotransferase [Pseudomonadota bacterium]